MQKVRVPIVKMIRGRMQREVSMIRELWKMGTWHLTILKPANRKVQDDDFDGDLLLF